MSKNKVRKNAQSGKIDLSMKRILKISLVALFCGTIIYFVVLPLIPFFLFWIQFKFAGIEVNTDITKYEEYIGQDAKDKFISKHSVDEAIFPKNITSDMNTLEYKMTYYDPWEEQFLSYLTVRYSEDRYKLEKERLQKLGIDEYKGFYCAENEPNNYDLLALEADYNGGFVYALTPEEQDNTVTYVEIIFAPYFLDLNVEEYIPKKYLLEGLDVSKNNEYRKAHLN